MLQLKDISKSYTTGDFTQVALDDVSVSFRDNEFVAILGPSGSGKTTMLNIIGGLDHYDSGDLLIDGISTKDYKDKDWDTFRNNRVGFVFQSYNLIPHQSILANVELALTLCGVDKEERQRRAKEALEKVGLSEHINKKPNQLSGGQMQRVAIARALINDPEIVLADEPTGALDSKTSIQIMDLLTEIAQDRLVVMVTHNPELAEEYATRIVTLSDGQIRADTDAFTPSPSDERENKKKIRPARMSFATAISLSFNNLMSKLGRTIMTAFAGSIGIIGIAAILALANGVNGYIKSVEEDTLTVYPLQINSSGFDMTAMMGGMSNMDDGTDDVEAVETGSGDDTVHEVQVVSRMFSSIGNNDLASLKEYLDSDASDIDEYARSIEYTYNVTPQIYDADVSNGVYRINPDNSFSALGIGTTNVSFMSSFMSTDIFDEMVGDKSIIEEQYDVVAGHWPEKYNECILVLGPHGRIQDFFLYKLGLRDPDQLNEMITQLTNEEEITVDIEDIDFTYSDIMDVKMKLVNEADYYQYDPDYDVWVDKSDNEEYMADLIASSEDIVISGIISPKEGENITAYSTGIYYTPELIDHLIDYAAQTEIVKQQLADPDVDIFNGIPFEDEQSGDADTDFDMSSLFSVDESALKDAFKFDADQLDMDMSSLDLGMDGMDMSGMGSSSSMPPMDPSILQMESGPTINEDGVIAATAIISQDFQEKAGQLIMEDPSLATDQEGLIRAYMNLPSTQALMAQLMPTIMDTSEMQAEMAQKLEAYMTQALTAYMNQMVNAIQMQIQNAIQNAMTQMMSEFAEKMSSAMSIDVSAFERAFNFNFDQDEITELILSMMTSQEASLDNNLSKLGYANMNKPSGIDIYPKDFESKQEIISILDHYNEMMADDGEEDKEITYTDIVGTLMRSVTTIIDMISYMLIAFVSISLIVSSIMIGIITYISVLERRKEIGILRAVGASKGDVSRIFNAETIIEGLAAGVLGVSITAIACIPASMIIYSAFNVPNIASLPFGAAIILILISVLLSFIAGLIPASSASRKDPVEALRSE